MLHFKAPKLKKKLIFVRLSIGLLLESVYEPNNKLSKVSIRFGKKELAKTRAEIQNMNPLSSRTHYPKFIIKLECVPQLVLILCRS